MISNIKICNLRINNFATIESQEINFEDGFNAIVGETGSGKSLILNAFNILLGNKADKKFIRKGSNFYTVEGTFHSDEPFIKEFFAEQNIFIEDEFIIKRVINKEGSSKSFINLQSIPASLIRSFSLEFFDIIGQHENQKLLQSDYQLKLLDHYVGNDDLLKKYQAPFQEYLSLSKELEQLNKKFEQAEQQVDYLDFQIQQIDELNPSIDDEIKLLEDKESIQNAMSNSQNLKLALEVISDNSNSNILSLTNHLLKLVDELSVPSEIANKTSQLNNLANELSYELSRLSTEESSEEQISSILDRLDKYQKLKRKFKTDTEGLTNTWEEFTAQRAEFQSLEEKISLIRAQISKIRNVLQETSTVLHNSRISQGPKLSADLQTIFKKINLKDCHIKFNLEKQDDFKITGTTFLNTLIQTNAGEDFQPLAKIASGGELSRILLSFRTCCSDPESISIFLFDEVDAGLGGKTAKMIGELIKEISSNSQVIAITHLPQIAGYADNIIHVYKDSNIRNKTKRTWTQTDNVPKDEKAQFVRDMISL